MYEVQWLESSGRPCRGHLKAQQAGIGPGSLCQLHLRLRGGGGDGGATGAESRISYLEMYMGKKVDKASPCYSYRGHATQTPALNSSQRPKIHACVQYRFLFCT